MFVTIKRDFLEATQTLYEKSDAERVRQAVTDLVNQHNALLLPKDHITYQDGLEHLVGKMSRDTLFLRDQLAPDGDSSPSPEEFLRVPTKRTRNGQTIQVFKETLKPEAPGSGIYTVQPRGEMALRYLCSPCRCDVYVAGMWQVGLSGSTGGKFLKLFKPCLIARTDTVELVCEDPRAVVEAIGQRIE